MKFFKCKKCGNFVGMIHESGAPMTCCGEQMKEVIAGTTDGAKEKHVPVYTVEGNKVVVSVGSVEHPMLEEHYIQWIALETNQGAQRKVLQPGTAPRIEFALAEGETVEAVYEFCNLHGLWKA